jgi:hypothetical protein
MRGGSSKPAFDGVVRSSAINDTPRGAGRMPAAVSVFDFDIYDPEMAELQCEAAVEAAEIDNWTEHSAAVIAAFAKRS